MTYGRADFTDHQIRDSALLTPQCDCVRLESIAMRLVQIPRFSNLIYQNWFAQPISYSRSRWIGDNWKWQSVFLRDYDDAARSTRFWSHIAWTTATRDAGRCYGEWSIRVYVSEKAGNSKRIALHEYRCISEIMGYLILNINIKY